MTESTFSASGVLQTLIVGHLWQSVAVAAVLALALIFGRRMTGAARHALAAVAFAACLMLPLISLVPGERLVNLLLEKTRAPVTLVDPSARSARMMPASKMAPATEAQQGQITPPDAEARDAAAVSAFLGALPAVANLTGAPRDTVDALREVHRIAAPVLSPSTVPAAPDAPVADVTTPTTSAPLVRMPRLDIPDFTLPLLAVWLAGVVILLVRLGRDLIAVEQMVARAQPVKLSKALALRLGKVRVAVSADAPGPMAAGLFRPCVMLPESAASQLDSPEMGALLEHERAHIIRRDMLAALAQRVVLALLWWSPALYWISRRIDEEREVACDEAAVARTGDARAFARSLTSQAENQLWQRAPRLAVGAIGPRSQFGRRIRRLIDLAKGAAPAGYSGRLAFSGLALAALIAVIVTPRIAADTPKKEAPPTVDQSLDGKPVDLTRPIERPERAERIERTDLHQRADRTDLDDQSLDALADDIAREVEQALADISPELDGLGGQLGLLGADIAAQVSDQVLAQMPAIMAEVDRALAEAAASGDVDQEEVRQALEEARIEIKRAMGPEFKAELDEAMAEARRNIADSRGEIARALREQRVDMEEVRAALAEARAEIEAARARGEFDIDAKRIVDEVRKAGVDGKRGVIVRTSGGEDNSPEAQLYVAAKAGDLASVRRLLDDGSDADRIFPGEGTALMAAVRGGNIAVVKALLADGADVDRVSPRDGTALIVAAERGNVDMVKLLLAEGADVDLGSPGDGNPLIAAATHGKTDVAKMLIKAGADINAFVPNDETPLINAASAGQLAVVKLLVEKGADVNLAFRSRGELRSPLGMAQKRDHGDVAAYLKSKGAIAEPEAAN
jgi:beta-lactamase regulating signal transducer with metallopeptidase domain